MQNLFEELKKILAKNPRFTVEGKISKNKISEVALKLDPEFIKILLAQKNLKKHFFTEIAGAFVFDKIKFTQFINNKEFLPDSYTTFAESIGLSVGNELMKKMEQPVVLSWPYKDCVLEGDMRKEDEDRDEVFYNEILAPDEIDRLLEPKVFTNFKCIDKKGKHQLKDFSRDKRGNLKDNLIIKGNNLLALYSLEKEFAGRIRMIYIDPIYNEEGTVFYNDSFNHSSWLTFMKNRLEIAKNLLQNDGVIFIQIGDTELAYLKVLADEVFRRENFISTISRVAKTASNKGTYFAPSVDFILCYAKNKTQLPEFYDKVDESLYKKIEKGGPRKGEKYRDDVAFYQSSLDTRPNQRYYIECPDGQLVIPPGKTFSKNKEDGGKATPEAGDGVWRWAVESYREHKNLLVFKQTKNSPLLDENGKQAKWNLYTKSYLKDRQESGTRPRNYLDKFINRKGADYIKKLGIDFKYSKPVELIKYLIDIVGTKKDDIILDFFAGSATTAEAVIRVNKEDGGKRQFIICEQMDYMKTATVPRIHKVIEDYNFVYCELKENNEFFAKKIKAAKDKKELQKIWEEMKKTAFLSYKINPKMIDDHAKDFKDLSLTDQKRFLDECLEKNHLYVNFSDIDDEDFKVNIADKTLNEKFYKR